MKRYKDLPEEEKRVWNQRIQLYGGIALIFVCCALFLRYYNVKVIKNDGILPTPKKVVEAMAVTYYAQDDSRWAEEALGDTGYTMGQEGSLFACLSMVLETNGITVTPQELNRVFMENGMYIDGRAADVTRLPELYPQISLSAPQDFDGGDITKALKNGRACMVRIAKETGVHWLCVVGSNEDTFLVLDPLGGGAMHELTDYGNVYALILIK